MERVGTQQSEQWEFEGAGESVDGMRKDLSLTGVVGG